MEHDLLGDKAVPADALYGVQTARALENFRISEQTLGDYPELVDGFVRTKIAAARANAEVGALAPEVRDAIVAGGEAILAGRYRDQFLVDPYQGGAGTSTNMNVNEVLANAALLETGRSLGAYDVVSPLDHVNRSQSTNDSYPTALKVAIASNNDTMLAELERLVAALRSRGDEYLDVVKMGRTEMQDAVPMTLGQEFHAFASALESEIAIVRAYEAPLFSINMGGTAIGTGLNAPEGYAERTAAHLAELTGKPFAPAPDLIAATWDQQAFLSASAATRSVAVKLSKIASDLMLLSSGPRAGFGEINLPPMQPGSSIMPGKVNPVILELTNIVAFRVIGNDLSVVLAARNGQLQLNAYEPLEALAILESQRILTRAMRTLRERCIEGITVNRDTLAGYIERTVGIVTALVPVLGYERSTELAKRAYETDRGILELLREERILTDAQIEELLDPEKLTGLDREQYRSATQR
ncbi:MAG: aspartate ammonia-lyase [Pseudomonadales bacterium]|nr:aspartate ammonia-lyase [Pseudomonadales bacterium]